MTGLNVSLALAASILAFSGSTAAMSAEPRPAMPTGSPGTWVTTNDYPSEALRDGLQGTSEFEVDIDGKGAPTKCTITASSSSGVLDAKTCELIMQRARFTVPLDEKGGVTTGAYRNRVRWVLPPDRTLPIPVDFAFSFVVGPDGKVSDCQVIRAEGGAAPFSAEAGAKLCDRVSVPHVPYRNASGEARRKRVIVSNSVVIEDIAP